MKIKKHEMSRILNRVVNKFEDREKEGMVKYKTNMDRNDLDLGKWLTHLQEELMDATLYVEKIMQEVQYQEYDLAPEKEKINYPEPRYRENEIMGDKGNRTTWENPGGSYWENQLDPDVAEHNHNVEREKQAQEEFAKEEAREERMKIIGQNGNDGLHYIGFDPLGKPRKVSSTLYPGDISHFRYINENED